MLGLGAAKLRLKHRALLVQLHALLLGHADLQPPVRQHVYGLPVLDRVCLDLLLPSGDLLLKSDGGILDLPDLRL